MPEGTLPGGAVIDIRGVTRRYKTQALEGMLAVSEVTLRIEAGSVVAMRGPSGSGKSTLLHLIGAMDAADAGAVWVDDVEVTSLSRKELAGYRRGVGFVFQRFHLLSALTALDNVVAPVLPYRTDFDKLARAKELMESVGLSGKGLSLPGRLSGGEQQRVAIARALINHPRLLLADEPTGNLDSATGREIMRLLLRLRAELGMTVVVATHDPIVASRCDRIVELEDGQIADDMLLHESMDPDEVLDQIRRLD